MTMYLGDRDVAHHQQADVLLCSKQSRAKIIITRLLTIELPLKADLQPKILISV